MKTVKIILILMTLGFCVFFCVKNSFLTSAQSMLAKDNLLKNWRPTKTIAGIKYIGNQECLKCHTEKQQLDTPMAHAILKPFGRGKYCGLKGDSGKAGGRILRNCGNCFEEFASKSKSFSTFRRGSNSKCF